MHGDGRFLVWRFDQAKDRAGAFNDRFLASPLDDVAAVPNLHWRYGRDYQVGRGITV